MRAPNVATILVDEGDEEDDEGREVFGLMSSNDVKFDTELDS